MITCDVCDRERETFVAASTIGPISLGYCKECLQRHAEPAWGLRYLMDDVGGGKEENLAPWVKELTTFSSGRYQTWQEFVHG